ncbi:unnamed protein product [Paramecium octaurelia]|uniref:Fatty acid hydroxylase domain-containing protein n=1 Tax=Paramecium octaurelia TaxID=43137 RepID=A0A8S1SNH3_PAROT|nr:unnamed protein product [Paramecium octaurelia]
MDSSNDSSVSSEDTNDGIIEREEGRYQRKGYGLIFAMLFTLFGFTVFPQIIQYQYLSWLQVLQPQYIQMIMLISTHLLGFSLGNLGMYFIYKAKSPFFERYRTRQNPWPWDENPEQWRKKRREVWKSTSINMCLGVLMCILDTLLSPLIRNDIDSFPTIFEMIWQIVFSMLIEDTCFYWTHRTLHSPKLYSIIHKKHHEFYTSVSYAAIYTHPIEYMFGNVIPVFIGQKILGNKMHIATLQLWLLFRIGETIDGHSGYEFSWSPYRLLPFSSSAESHNYHHSHNVGNYGSFFVFWDTIMGSNKSYNSFIAEKYGKIKKIKSKKKE